MTAWCQQWLMKSWGALVATRELGFFVGVRIVLLICALTSAAVSPWLTESAEAQRYDYLYGPLTTLLALSVISLAWLLRACSGNLFRLTQLALDLLTITGAVWLTGGVASPFLFLYLPPVMACALLASRAAAFTYAAAAALCYTCFAWGLFLGYIPTADDAPVGSSTSALALQLIGLYSALFLVAVLTSFLARNVQRSNERAQRAEDSLSALGARQAAIMRGFPDGIVTLSAQYLCMNVNKAACLLLGLSESALLGKSLIDVLGTLDPQASRQVEQESIGEFELPGNDPDSVRKVSIRLHRLFGDAGQPQGFLATVQDITKLRSAEEQLEAQERMARLLATRDDPQGEPQSGRFFEFVSESRVMEKVFNLISRVAPSDATVLVYGESGTGKELVARAIHQGSPRAQGPFVAVNCGAIPETLLESQFFGHKKGSFTSAESDTLGFFRQAQGGTLLLDEIGELPVAMQAKLLRALQEKKVRPVGGDRDIPIDIRIIAATNRNLRREVEQSNFREDLYYRLNVISISLPPLRERREDIPLLAHATFTRLCKDKNPPVISPAALKFLTSYSYPGNVRELENILERALVLGGEVILPEHLPDLVKAATETPLHEVARHETAIIIDESIELPLQLDELLAKIERRYLEEALLRTQGAKKRAADLLGMNFRSFRYRLSKYGMRADGE
jgi:two-component system response regulator PilR (NtrC family)